MELLFDTFQRPQPPITSMCSISSFLQKFGVSKCDDVRFCSILQQMRLSLFNESMDIFYFLRGPRNMTNNTQT